MTPQQVILLNINSGKYSNLVIAMLIIAHFILGGITAAQVTSDLALINCTFDSSAITVSDGATTYTVNALIINCIGTEFTTVIALGSFVMDAVIKKAYTKSYITSAEETTLLAAVKA